MLTLLDVPLSPYAQKVKMALMEKGLAFETRIPSLKPDDAELRAASPRMEVPALLDGELRLFDSSIILEYLEDRFPETALLPTTAAERARVRMIEEICDTTYDAVTWGIAELVVFNRAEGEARTEMLTRAAEQVAGLNTWLERELGAREWFNGDQFGFGDIAVFPFVNGAAGLNCRPAPDSRLAQWWKAVKQRPSAERCKQDVIDTLPDFMNRPKEIAEGKRQREYRDHRLDWMMRSGGAAIVLAGIETKTIRFSEEIR